MNAETVAAKAYPQEIEAWTVAEKNCQTHAGEALAAEIEKAISEGKHEFVIPSGDYRFSGEKGLRIESAHHFSIKAEGVTFWFTPKVKYGVEFRNCSHSALSGLTIDMDGLPFLQGRIKDIKEAEKELLIQLDRYSDQIFKERKDIHGYRVMFLDSLGMFETDNIDFRPEFNSVTYCGQGLLNIKVDDYVAEHWNYQLHQPCIGDKIAIGLRNEGGMIRVSSCGGMIFRDITVFASQGFAFFEDGHGEGNNQYYGCKLIRRPGTNRLLAGAADCFHSLNQKKGPLLEKCEFSWAMDDLINIHGFFQVILEKINEQEVVVAAPHDTHYELGSEILFYAPPFGKAIDHSRVTKFERASGTEAESTRKVQEYFTKYFGIAIRDFPEGYPYKVTLDCPTAANAFDLAMTGDYCCSGSVIRNNYLHDGHVRGILIKSPNSVIEGNRIERIALCAIAVKPELYWLEGPLPGQITISNNFINDCAFDFTGVSPILVNLGFCTPPNDRITGESVMEGIVVEGNCVRKSNSGPGIVISNCSAPVVKNNAIWSPHSNVRARNVLSFKNRIDLNYGLDYGEKAMAVIDDPKYAILFIACEKIDSSENSLHETDGFCHGTHGVGIWCSG